jgi:SWI/SNF-related matrix-associated actin-dependent regulator 1 of chromatin subfamily A
MFFTLTDPPPTLRSKLLAYPGVSLLEAPPSGPSVFSLPANLAPVVGLELSPGPACETLSVETRALLRPYQLTTVEAALRRRSTYIAYEVGTGKTRTAAVIAKHSGRATLVVAPKSVRGSWQRELQRLGYLLSAEDPAWYACIGTKPDRSQARNAARNATWIFCNYEILHAWAPHLYDLVDTVVFDEATAIKGKNARRTKAATIAAMSARRVLMLSGTPILNRPNELWAPLHVMEPHAWGTLGNFRARYCGLQYIDQHWKETQATNEDELKQRLDTIMVVETVESVKLQLPSIQHVQVPLDPTHDIQKLDGVAVATFVKYLAGGGSLGRASLERMNELRLVTSRMKVPSVVEFVAGLIENGCRPVVFSWYREIAASIAKALPSGRAIYVHGEQDAGIRESLLNVFINEPDTVDAVCATYKSIGMGIDGLQLASHTAVFVDYDWPPATLIQAAGRLYRDRQLHPVTCYHTTMNGTFDEILFRAVERKQTLINKLILSGKSEVDLNWATEAELQRDVLAYLADARELKDTNLFLDHGED